MDTAAGNLNDFVANLVQMTKSALKNSSRYQQPPEMLNLAGYSNQTELWGADSALDFIETRWEDLAFYLRKSAESKKMHANVLVPTMGKRAATQMDEYVKQALPGCRVTINSSVMTVDWTDLI